MKTWKCTACNALHTGTTPPDDCRTCHAPASSFVLQKEPPGTFMKLFGDLQRVAVPHAIAAHFPNALTPTLALFSGLSWLALTDYPLRSAMLPLLLILLVMVPATFVTGVVDWKRHYRGAMLPLFKWKIGLGIGLIVTTLISVLLHLLAPAWSASGSGQLVDLGLQLVMLVFATGLGHLGGKLVFAQRKS